MIFEENEVRALTKALYVRLKRQGLFKEWVEGKNYPEKLERMRHQLNILSRKREIIQNYLSEYMQWNMEYTNLPMPVDECLVEFTTLYCNCGLVHYEALKQFFLRALHIDKLNVKQHYTYGQIVKSFEKLSGFDPRMSEMLDNDFRNALAHDTWYIKDDSFMYSHVRDDKLVKIPIYDIPEKINTILILYVEIKKKYTKDFSPDVVKNYETRGRSEVNKEFPIYGMEED